MKIDVNALKTTRAYAEEALVVDVQSLLETVMHAKGLTRAQLAEAMGVSRARVSQMFSSDASNFTVRLLARALHAMGEQGQLTCDMHRKIRRGQAMAEVVAGAARFDTDWSVQWEHAYGVANDHGPSAAGSSIEVAGGTGKRDFESRIAQSLRRASHRQLVAA